jgi:hypothetical protein
LAQARFVPTEGSIGISGMSQENHHDLEAGRKVRRLDSLRSDITRGSHESCGRESYATMNGKAAVEMCEEARKHDAAVLEWWKRTNGLHTQEKWVTNYRQHPGPWAGLLTIHGVPEVVSRLRNKVENYAVYSVFILSGSIGITAKPPDELLNCSEDSFGGIWTCQVLKYTYLICMYVGIIKFMECILLAMAFVNALNETARDCDVYRMFSRGKGYVATVSVQMAFRYGVGFNFIAVMLAGFQYVNFVAPVFFIGFSYYTFRNFQKTANLLFATASAQDYWRPEKGGKPDAGDPYDLEVPMVAFKDRVEDGKTLEKRLRDEIIENKDTRRHADALIGTIEKIAELNAVQDEKYGKKSGEATPKKDLGLNRQTPSTSEGSVTKTDSKDEQRSSKDVEVVARSSKDVVAVKRSSKDSCRSASSVVKRGSKEIIFGH